MLNSLVNLSLRYKVLALAAFLILIFFGVNAVRTVPMDAFPDVTPPQVNVYTESPGLAAEDVEKLITFPVETSMAGLPGIEEIRSVSLFGLSYVSAYFVDGTDMHMARHLVADKLHEAAERIPDGYGTPSLGPNSSGLGQVLFYSIAATDPNVSQMDLRTFQDWTARLILRTTPGVDDVASWGAQEKQYQVLIDPQKLLKYGLTFKEVIESVASNNRQVGGRYLDVGHEQYLVRGIGTVQTAEDIGNTMLVEYQGTPVHVHDVARVVEGSGLRSGAVSRDGHEVVLGMMLARTGENASEVVAATKKKLEEVKENLPPGMDLEIDYDRSDLIGKAIAMVEGAMVEGVILVIIVLFVFLGGFQSSLIVVLCIPLVFLLAFIPMKLFGVSANLMSLGGLIIGLGMTIDGPVVLVENAFRLLAHRAKEGTTLAGRTAIVMDAAKEVMNPIAFGVLIIIVVFLPLFALTGLEGKMFSPLALNMTFGMVGSLLLTIGLVPVLCVLFLRPKDERDPWIIAKIKKAYLPALMWALGHKKIVIIGCLSLFIPVAIIYPFLGKEFMPRLQEQGIMFRVTSIPSTSLDESLKVAKRAETTLDQSPEVAHSLSMIGRAEKGEVMDVNYMEILTELKPRDQWPDPSLSYDDLAERLQADLQEHIPTVVVTSTQPIQQRVEELISGVRATLALKVYGKDLEEIHRLTTRLKSVLSTIPGVSGLAQEASRGKPQVVVEVKRAETARYGINVDEIMEVVQYGIGGKAVSQVISGVQRFDVQVWLDEPFRNSIDDIGQLPIRTSSGAQVPLSQVTDISLREGWSFIRREQLQRYAVIELDVKGRDIDGFVRDAEGAINAAVTLPPGYKYEWGGAFANQQHAMATLSIIVPITIGLIFLLLYTAFDSLKYATLIITNVPFAAIGGVLSLFISQQYLSVPAAVGFIGVFGVAMLNGIVLISFLRSLQNQGHSVRDAVVEGASLRLRPVLMTALVEILGLIPFLFSTGVGAEVLRPLATVVIGGLFTSTALTLLLLPVVYEWLENRAHTAIPKPLGNEV